MKLKHLLSAWTGQTDKDCEVLALQNDSRQIQPGDLFFAYPGAAQDGRLFIDKALAAGAAAIVYDPIGYSTTNTPQVPCVAIPDLAQHLASIAARFYNNPSQALEITGITGTNGKTTIAYQLAQAHDALGQKAAYIGTIGQGEVKHLQALNNTTPDALCLLKLLNGYHQQGLTKVCMEVSSHALAQGRVDAVEFNQAIFTNLSLDHLDYHQTMESYAAAKAQLFARSELQWVILNQDDAYASLMSQASKAQVKQISYGIHKDCEVKAIEWHTDVNGTDIKVKSPWGQAEFNSKSIGQFNLYNSLAVFTSLLASGYPLHDVVQIMPQLKPAPGRMEVVMNSPYVLVDYAHTPDALKNVLITLNQLKKGRLWVVFGCGGDRDKTKRPLMGEVASLYADQIILTSDNPRSEDPASILKDIAKGIPAGTGMIECIQREEAIAYALDRVEKDDIVLIAGKGHEAYQQIGFHKHPFSDQEVIRRLKARLQS